jgi:hypothetical protein
MWPLLCHEIGLSYEQEDKVRNTQRAILADTQSWIHRHTAAATKNVLDSLQTTVASMHEAAKKRENSVLSVLTPEQRTKFYTWAIQKSDAIQKVAQANIIIPHLNNQVQDYQVSSERHVAANMYIVDHQLTKLHSQLTPPPIYVHPSRLKKLSRRPSFESLAGQDALENNTKSNKLSRDASFPSTGSLKRTLNELNYYGDTESHHPTLIHANTGITVESAHAAAQPAVRKVFHDIMPLVPQAYHHQMNLEHFQACTPSMTTSQAPVRSSPITTAPEALYAKSRVTTSIPIQQPQPQYHVDPPLPPPPPSSDEIDIPMPTPVSVLLRTQDEFLDVETATSSGVPVEVTSSLQTAESGYIPSIEYAPEPAVSLPRNHFRSYQSAPQLYTGNSNEFDYPSLMQSTMMPVPEESYKMSALESNAEEDGFNLEELGDPHDWAIGESFDMDLETR